MTVKTSKLFPNWRPNPDWHGLNYLIHTKWWITDWWWAAELKIHWHVAVLFSSFHASFFLLTPLFFHLPFTHLFLCALLTALSSSSTTHRPSPSSTPSSFPLPCVSLHAWLAAVISASPSVIRGQCRNRCITGRYLTTQHFTGQALYHLSSLTAQWR